jgi:hypothetical protein
VRFIRGFFRFWYDFIIGEDWRVAAGVTVVLAIGAVLVAQTELSDEAIAVLVAAGTVGFAFGGIALSAMRARS